MGVGGVRFVQNVHIYENGHNWGRKLVSRHDSGDSKGNLIRKKMGYPTGFVDLIYFKFFNIGDWRTDINPKNAHIWGPKGSPMARIWHVP